MKNIIIEWFKNKYNDLYKLMNEVTHTHDNGELSPYHMEGSIWNHTMLVLDWLSAEDKNLIFAALLHDIGKVKTRIQKENKVSFTYHENVSTYMSIDILKEAKKEFKEIDIIKILKMIAWHGSLWLKNGNLEHTLQDIDFKYGHCIDFYKEFVQFVEADALGRVLQHKYDEDNVLEQSNFLANYQPYDRTKFKTKPKNEVIFLIGISGSGKSTYVEKKIDKNKYKILSVDNILSSGKLDYSFVDYKKNVKKAFDETIKTMLEYVKNEQNMIIDMTNLDKENRRRKLSKIPSTKFHKKAIVFLNGIDSIKNNLKIRESRENKKISLDVINYQMFNFEIPNYDEFDEIEFII